MRSIASPVMLFLALGIGTDTGLWLMPVQYEWKAQAAGNAINLNFVMLNVCEASNSRHVTNL